MRPRFVFSFLALGLRMRFLCVVVSVGLFVNVSAKGEARVTLICCAALALLSWQKVAVELPAKHEEIMNENADRIKRFLVLFALRNIPPMAH